MIHRKPKKKTGRKLFTQKYDEEEDETNHEKEPKSVKKKPIKETDLIVEIPRFTHKLFDPKNFGTPSSIKTPNLKNDIKIDEFKTPGISRILAERKTPFGMYITIHIIDRILLWFWVNSFLITKCLLRFAGSAKSKLDSPPKVFGTYSFLKSLDGNFFKIL